MSNLNLIFIIITLSSLAVTLAVAPYLLNRLRKAKIVGIDVNKADKREIPEMGGLAAFIGFLFSLSVVLLVIRAFSNLEPMVFTSIIAAIGVFAIASMIGIIDDLVGISRRKKAIYVMFASIPLIIGQCSDPMILLPFHSHLDFTGVLILYWLIIVPVGITGVANAMNMCAGYNGLESGEITIISFFLLIISYLNGTEAAVLIFSGLLGASIGLFIFNKYPAKMFVGDVGTLGLGAVIGAGCIVGNIGFYGILCILPAFYELFATIYYGSRKMERRDACMNPIILDNGKLKPPRGAEKFTLSYLLLSKKPMHEAKLVNRVLSIYVLCGLLSLGLSLLG